MNNKELSNLLLSLYYSFIITIDKKKKIIEELYVVNNLEKTNISYEEAAHALADTYKLKDNFSDKIDRFLSELKLENHRTVFNLNYETIKGNKITLFFNCYEYEEDKYIIAISRVSKQKDGELDIITKTTNYNVLDAKARRAIENHEQFTLVKFSIDDYKNIINKSGRLFGDILLIEAVSAFKSILGENGIISRVSDTEFLMYMPIDNDYDTVHAFLQKLQDILYQFNNHNIMRQRITATMGTSSYPKDGDNMEILLRKAEKAYRRGQSLGGDKYIIYLVEKSGIVTGNEPLDLFSYIEENTVNSMTHNINTGIIDILNRKMDYYTNVKDSLTLIGTYFLLDRIVFISCTTEMKIANHMVWVNHKNREKDIDNIVDGRDFLITSFDQSGMIKFNQVGANKNHVLYKDLQENNVSAMLGFRLDYDGVVYGYIGFEYCDNNHFWDKEEISALRLISKLFSIAAKQERENLFNYKRIFFDETLNTYNYRKWQQVVYTKIENNNYEPYSVLSIRILDFHAINTMVSRTLYIKILKLIADVLEKLRCEDIVFFHDNDDRFGIYFPYTDLGRIYKIFEAIQSYITENNPFRRINLNLAGGLFVNKEKETLELSLDKAIITSDKADLNNRYMIYSNEIQKKVQEKVRLEMHMNKALEAGEFKIYYQPKINTVTEEIVGAEALSRWYFNEMVLLSPGSYIPLFEENGFIEQLDYYVFESVCKFLRQMIDEGNNVVPISLNVSRYIIDFETYIDNLNKIREKYDVPANLIGIEITEGMFVDNNNAVSKLIDALHESGYIAMMDDFGSGYSNLSSLSDLNFDVIKLDKNFCRKQSPKNQAILGAIIEMLKSLEVEFLCEGVETEEQAEYLRNNGTNIVQGYLFDKPLPEKKFIDKYMK